MRIIKDTVLPGIAGITILPQIRATGAAQMYTKAAPESIAHPVGECDRSGEGEAGSEFGEGEHI